MSTRRNFIRNTALTSLGMAILPGLSRALPLKKANIGLQLYTVRDQLEADFTGTLRKIKKTGYTWLEAAGYGDGKFYGMAPAEFRKIVQGMGMEVISSHASFAADKQKEAITAHKELGVKYLVYPGFPIPEHNAKNDFIQAAARLNAIGAKCNKDGIRFGYHNHDFEFINFNDKKGYDILIENTEPSMVCFEPDIYWMTFAGVDPLEYFGKYAGRFELWHVKDMKGDPGKGFAEVGTGTINYDEIFKAAELSGMKYFFVEQDDCEMDPLLSIEVSYNNLRALLD
jgi:sugar phosphate isomerase/epimerase